MHSPFDFDLYDWALELFHCIASLFCIWHCPAERICWPHL